MVRDCVRDFVSLINAPLSLLDTISFFTIILGLMRANIPVFPISPRNSAPATAHLIWKAKASHILISVERPIRDLVNEALAELENGSLGNRPGISTMPTYEDLYMQEAPFEQLPTRKYDYSVPAVFVHTSGTVVSLFHASFFNGLIYRIHLVSQTDSVECSLFPSIRRSNMFVVNLTLAFGIQ